MSQAADHDPRLADSAGQPWKGRHFESHGYERDDGAASAALIGALTAFREGRAGQADVVDAVRTARLLVPLVAHAGEEGHTAEGLRVDKTQELSLVTVAGPDGRTVLPVFSSVEALARWNPAARPIPVASRRAALAAAAERTDVLVLDPASPTEFAVRRPALWAIAQDTPWSPAAESPEVLAAFRSSVAGEASVTAIALAAGDPDARLAAPEVVVELSLVPGLDAAALTALLGRLQGSWAADEVIAGAVDSMAVRLR
ncbi:SseB family protein [Cnuibacter physcomitrellae]|uniref:SseB family protein n=1 Tax=Cnuibacter physcomitrellae TaxID=1619308 RepID=UPI002175719E|nr:SseB family protein [Cnuibacter physcomitrellae]MCS5499470.1 SseB family protein [Cnuibacter physcomitrellae]